MHENELVSFDVKNVAVAVPRVDQLQSKGVLVEVGTIHPAVVPAV